MKFSYKLALTIALSVIITFVVLDISLIILYKLVVSKQAISGDYDINAFNQFSSTEILSSTQNYVETGLQIYEQVITEVYQSYDKFHNNPDLYTSKQAKNINPPPTSSFTTPRYDRSSVYFFTPESTFYDEPYLDSALSCAITATHPLQAKRVNIFYQNTTNLANIMARTTPATDDFIIPSVQTVTSRFDSSLEGKTVLTPGYNDTLSKSSNTTQLFAIRLMFPNITGGYRMLIQIQIYLRLVSASFNIIYAYESSAIALLYLLNSSTSNFSYMGASKTLQKYENFLKMQNYLEPGIYNVSNQETGDQFLLCSTDIKNHDLTQTGKIQDHKSANLRLIYILNKSETNLANTAYSSFLVSEERALMEFLFVWSVIVISVMIGIGYALADYLFSYFSLIIKKCREYIKNPQKAESLYFEMKQIASQQNHNRIIIQNMISIIQKIQSKKKMNQGVDVRKDFIKQKKKQKKSSSIDKIKAREKKKQEKKQMPFDEYPLNLLSKEFQDKMKIKDGERFQKIREQLCMKLKAAAEAKAAQARAAAQKKAQEEKKAQAQEKQKTEGQTRQKKKSQ